MGEDDYIITDDHWGKLMPSEPRKTATARVDPNKRATVEPLANANPTLARSVDDAMGRNYRVIADCDASRKVAPSVSSSMDNTECLYDNVPAKRQISKTALQQDSPLHPH